MTITRTPTGREITFTGAQLLSFVSIILLPGIAACFMLVTRIVTLENVQATQANEARAQAQTLAKIQETLTQVRIQLASSIARPAPAPPTTDIQP